MHGGTFAIENKYGEAEFQICEECDPILRKAARRCKFITIALFIIVPILIFLIALALNEIFFDKDD